MKKFKVDFENLTIQEVEDVLFDDLQDARDCLWDVLFARYGEWAETFFNLPDAKPEEFMEWITEWKWREDVAKKELKKHGDYNAPKTAN